MLEAIEAQWEENALDATQGLALRDLIDGTRFHLHELERLLDRYQSLGGPVMRKRDRAKWTGKSLMDKINPIRSSLEKRMNQLAVFNQVITK